MSARGGGSGAAAAGELEALRARVREKMVRWYVDLCDVDLGDAGAAFVAEELRGNTVVEYLLLRTTVVEEPWVINCRIGAVGARALAESLAEDNNTLKSLDLKGSKLGDDGPESMAQMLRKNKTLEALFLSACGVGARGTRALGEALKENSTLKRLDLANNDIGDDASDSLAEALRWNESLENLNLSFSDLTDAGSSSLLSALRESNSSLRELDLAFNEGIKDTTITDSIKELLRENIAVRPASAERRARCLLFCCLQLAPKAHKHVVPSIGAVPVPVMQYVVEHAAQLHVAKRFEADEVAVRESSAGVRARSATQPSEERESAVARRVRRET